MTEQTRIDIAHAAMMAQPDDEAARLRFYECFSDGGMFVLLAKEAEGRQVEPAAIDVAGQDYIFVFDSEARLVAFKGDVAPYAGLSGRGLVQMLAGQGIGIALNPDVAPSAMLIFPDVIEWLIDILANRPEEMQAQPVEVREPTSLPRNLLQALDRKLASAGGLAEMAYLAEVSYKDGTEGYLLAFVDALTDAQDALANAASEALTFSGFEGGTMDVIFVQSADPITKPLEQVGLRFDLPKPEVPKPPIAPGTDPDKPPRLRN